MRLMPYMVRELYVMGSRAKELDDISGQIAGLFID